MTAIVLRPLSWVERRLLRLGGESAWSWSLTGTIAAALIAARHHPKVIYSSGGPASAHIVAAIVAALTRVPWIAELQDPLVYSNRVQSGMSKRLALWLERIIFRRAKKIIFYTHVAKARAEARQGTRKGVVIYPGALIPTIPRARSTVLSSGVCDFVYVGSLYQTRNLDKFLAALYRLLSSSPSLIARMAVNLYGAIHTVGIRERIEQFPFPVVQHHGMVSRTQALQAATAADVVLLVQNMDASSYETIPTKVFEYLLLGKPILGLVYGNDELRTLLERHGHTVVEADDVSGIEAAVTKLLEEWQAGTLENRILRYAYTAREASIRLMEEVGVDGVGRG